MSVGIVTQGAVSATASGAIGRLPLSIARKDGIRFADNAPPRLRLLADYREWALDSNAAREVLASRPLALRMRAAIPGRRLVDHEVEKALGLPALSRVSPELASICARSGLRARCEDLAGLIYSIGGAGVAPKARYGELAGAFGAELVQHALGQTAMSSSDGAGLDFVTVTAIRRIGAFGVFLFFQEQPEIAAWERLRPAPPPDVPVSRDRLLAASQMSVALMRGERRDSLKS